VRRCPMPATYEQLTDLPGVLARARELSLRTMIFDVEPMIAWWDTSQQSLDQGIAVILAELDQLPELRVLIFATNSARRPSALPSVPGVRIGYFSSAGKPLKTARYRGLPRPGAVVGDQVPTDGLLAYRLGFTFLQWDPPLAAVPRGPRLMQLLGRAVQPLFFSRNAAPGGPPP
jgi:predicted HAD superfamily phosphohydrolase YqeG